MNLTFFTARTPAAVAAPQPAPCGLTPGPEPAAEAAAERLGCGWFESSLELARGLSIVEATLQAWEAAQWPPAPVPLPSAAP